MNLWVADPNLHVSQSRGESRKVLPGCSPLGSASGKGLQTNPFQKGPSVRKRAKHLFYPGGRTEGPRDWSGLAGPLLSLLPSLKAHHTAGEGSVTAAPRPWLQGQAARGRRRTTRRGLVQLGGVPPSAACDPGAGRPPSPQLPGLTLSMTTGWLAMMS